MKWYDWHNIEERLKARTYALTRGDSFNVLLDEKIDTGYCDFTNKEIKVNPNLFRNELEALGLAKDKLDKAGFLISRSVCGHEALHSIYSSSKPAREAGSDPLLKTILNLLEDKRIEFIGSKESYIHDTLFKFVNSIAAQVLRPFDDSKLKNPESLVELLLRWRLSADIPKLTKAAKKKWNQVKDIADKAIYAKTTEDVLLLARDIQELIPLKEPENYKPPLELEDSNNQSIPETGLEAPKDNPFTIEDIPDYRGNGEDTKDSNPEPDKSISEQLDEALDSIDDNLDELLPETPKGSLIAKSKSHKGRSYPPIIASPYKQYMKDACKIADELIRDLKIESPKAVSAPSETPGRFKARNFIRNPQKPFIKELNRGLRVPKMAVSLVLDRSDSMYLSENRLRIAAIAITNALEKLKIPLSIWALEGQVHLKSFEESGQQILAKLAGIEACTLTTMLPTLRDAEDDLLLRSEELKVMFIVCDGMATDLCDALEWFSSIHRIHLFCIYIKPKIAEHEWDEIKETVNENLKGLAGRQRYIISDIDNLAKNVCSYIRNIRKK